MDERVLVLNADINRRSSDLLATADESWSDIQRQTVKIIQEATERMSALVCSVPDDDPEHWLHDLRSPGASMLSAINLLLDEVEFTPSSVNIPAVEILQEKILELRAAVEVMAAERQRL